MQQKFKPTCRATLAKGGLLSIKVVLFFLFQQTAVQSTILFLICTVDKILQTGSVVNDSAATIQTDMAVSDGDA